jgi:hypothetical protein
MIIACLIFYNEAQFLGEWVERVTPHVDKVVAIDGQIEGFPGEAPYSTDESFSLLKHEKITVISPTVPWPTEHAKRSAYLGGERGDWYVVIDADEMLEDGFMLRDAIDDIDPTIHDFAQIRVVGYGADRLAGRVIRHQPGLDYRHRHTWLGVGSEVLWKGDTGPILEGPYLRHLKNERTRERLQAKAKFHVRQVITENEVS